MEFGPRALGRRSILAHPGIDNLKDHINRNIKFREDFRPFAPAVLAEDVSDWFDLKTSSPYMLVVAPVAEHRLSKDHADMSKLFGIDKLNIVRSQIPAVTHVDFSARGVAVTAIDAKGALRDATGTSFAAPVIAARAGALPEVVGDAGLLDGDMVVVERNRPTKSGDIVVALVDNDMTVKYLFPLAGPGGWVLKPAHPDYPDILARESLEVVGVVVGMFRQMGR